MEMKDGHFHLLLSFTEAEDGHFQLCITPFDWK